VTIDATVPVFRVASVARSMKWYADVLGFEADAVGPPGDPVFAILRRDRVEIMIQKVQRGVGEPRGAAKAGGGWDLYLRVDDVRLLHEAVRSKIPAVGAIVPRPYGCHEFEVEDPDGHVLVLGQCGS
jgi:catechol 2,3-dioxygenase-like lactoylglutathione lyase family enzyme